MAEPAEGNDAPIFPFRRSRPLDPPDMYAIARSERPIYPVRLWNGRRAWLVTRHADYRAIIMDPRFSSEFGHPDFPAITPARVVVDKRERAFVGMDNPRHDHYRHMMIKEFSLKRMTELRPEIQAITDRLLDRIEEKGPPADLIADLGFALPSLVMCLLVGSPYEDHTYIAKCAAGRHGLTQTPEQALELADALVAYCSRLIDTKERMPADDFPSRVIAEHIKGGALTRAEFAEILAMILRAGHDTTTNMIGMGTLILLENPEELARLKSDPSLVEKAVEELLRLVAPVQFSPRRVAIADAEISGTLIAKGEGVFLLSAAANRDPEMFTAPDRIDITRDARHHMSFGYGLHHCLGAALARIELQVVFSTLFRRFPGLRLAATLAELPFKDDMQIYGVRRLPVAW